MKDIIGQKFNMLTVVGLDHIKDHIYPNGDHVNIKYYSCLCDCGSYTVVRRSEIGPNRTKSCGCVGLRKAVPDISGQKSNKLTAISRSERKGNYWNCLCDCGNQTVVSAKYFKSGGIKSCGCANDDWAKAQAHDLTGKEFGRLKVVSKSVRGGRYWVCTCDCGQTIETLSYSLTTGGTTSCGCFRKETAKNNLSAFIYKTREDAGLPVDVNKSSDNKLQRAEFIPLAREIYSRDLHTCVWCSKSGCKLNAHHLKTWAQAPDKRFDKTNLVTLCEVCHLKVHNNNWFSAPNPYMTILLQGYSNMMEDLSYECL